MATYTQYLRLQLCHHLLLVMKTGQSHDHEDGRCDDQHPGTKPHHQIHNNGVACQSEETAKDINYIQCVAYVSNTLIYCRR